VEKSRKPLFFNAFFSTGGVEFFHTLPQPTVEKIFYTEIPQLKIPHSTAIVDKVKGYKQELILAVMSRILSCRVVLPFFSSISTFRMEWRIVE